MKTKCFTLLLAALWLISLSAGAEIVGWTSDGAMIHRHIAPNGQEIFFTSIEEEPFIRTEDVNFDGQDDLVVLTVLGASNAYFEFFVWSGESYVMARHPGQDYGLCNYTLDERGYVVSHVSNGLAGALFEETIFAWEGTGLRPIRTMESAEYTTWELRENGFAQVTDAGALHVRLWDCRTEGDGDAPIWEKRYTMADVSPDDFSEMKTALWNGL